MKEIAELKKRIGAAIFDPGATEGYKGERTLTEWQVDAVMRMISAEAKESNEPIGRSVFKALATCGEIAYLALQSALSSHAPKEETGWRRMGLAPKTGETVIVRLANGEVFSACWHVYGRPGWHVASDIGFVAPTHWMPLPTPPSASNDGEEK